MKVTPKSLSKFQSGQSSNGNYWNKDQALVLMNQITWALLIVFVLAYVLSNKSHDSEMEMAKNKLNYYREKMQEIQATDQGKSFAKLEASLQELQRQKLLNALEIVDQNERAKMFLTSYLVDGKIQMENVLDGDKIKDENFVNGCNYAKERFADVNLKTSWQNEVLQRAEMTFPDNLEVDVILQKENLSVVNQANRLWLTEEINRRIRSLRSDATELQKNLLSLIQQYFEAKVDQGDISFLADSEVDKLVKRFTETTEEEKKQLPVMIQAGIRELIKKIVSNSKVDLLTDNN